MRAVLAGMAGVALTVALGGGASGQVTKVDAKLLVGKWVQHQEKGGEKLSEYAEFTADGKVAHKLVFISGKKEDAVKSEGTYKLEGAKIVMSLASSGRKVENVWTVTSLTEKELKTTSQSGEKDTYVRVVEKK